MYEIVGKQDSLTAPDSTAIVSTTMQAHSDLNAVLCVIDTPCEGAYQALLNDFSYKTGERYAEYRQGDKLAKYGLAALIAGGAAAVAVKTGLFASLILLLKKAWKLVVIAVAAIVAWFKRLINGGKNRADTSH